MAKIIPYPRFKAFDLDGTALANGTVEVKLAGTSTAVETFTDSTEGTSNGVTPTWVVTLDAYGEADIWVPGGKLYKIIMKDSDGTTVKTVDNVSPCETPTTLEANLDVNGKSIISTGNGDITLAPNGSGSIILDQHTWPGSVAAAGYTIEDDGAGNLSFVTNSGDVSADTSPTAGGDLDMDGNNILFDDATGINDANDNELLIFQTTTSAVNQIDIANAATGNAPSMTATGDDTNISVALAGKGTGGVRLNGILMPTSDGTANQAITAVGDNTTTWSTINTVVVNREYNTYDTYATITTSLPVDDTIPQNTEGDEVVTVTITPSSATNYLKITAYLPVVTASGVAGFAIFQDSTANALVATSARFTTNQQLPISFQYFMVSGTTSSTTFKLRAGPNSGTLYINGNTTSRLFGGQSKVVLVVEEFAT